MAKPDHLLQQTINRILDALPDTPGTKLPSAAALAQTCDVSRFTVNKALDALIRVGILNKAGRRKVLARRPKRADYVKAPRTTQSKAEQFETFFLRKLSRGELHQGKRYSELELAREAGCNTGTVREVLSRIESFGIIQKPPRQQWQVVTIDSDLIEELLDVRTIMELHAVHAAIALDDTHDLKVALRPLRDQHAAMLAQGPDPDTLANLDKALHAALYQCTQNRFMQRFFTLSSILIHFQLHSTAISKQRRDHMLQEHLFILDAILANDTAGAEKALRQHLATSRAMMYRAANLDMPCPS